MTEDSEVKQVDCRELSHTDIVAQLCQLDAESTVKLVNVPEGQPGLVAGLRDCPTVSIASDVGDFAYLLGSGSGLEIAGACGQACGHSMVGGKLTIHGHAGDYLGAYASGGLIAAMSYAGKRCAFGLNGADVFVRRTVGDEAGLAMRAGTLVLGNGAGKQLGHEMTGGIIYVRGDVESLSPAVRAIRIKDSVAVRLSLLLARAGIKSDGKDFKAYRPKETKEKQ